VFKKVRGVSEKLGEEFTRTVLHLHPRWRRSRSPSSR
jgi:hypothetical protein